MSDAGSTTYMNKRHAKPAKSPTRPASDDENDNADQASNIWKECSRLEEEIKKNYNKLNKCRGINQNDKRSDLEVRHGRKGKGKHFAYLEFDSRGFEDAPIGTGKEWRNALGDLDAKIKKELKDAEEGQTAPEDQEPEPQDCGGSGS